MRGAAFIFIAALLLEACSDVVQNKYATKAEAIADDIFAKGWLPDFIPDSATKIQVENDLDLNTSYGSFSYEPGEWAVLEKGANMQLISPAPFEGWGKTKTEFASKGYQQLQHSEDHTTWVFFCRPSSGTCEYFMWYRKPSA